MNRNILVLSAGRRVSLVKAFEAAISTLGIKGTVYGADLNPLMSAACNVLQENFVLPAADDDRFSDCLLSLCIEQNIQLVIPTIDTELTALAKIKSHFSDLGITIVVSDLALVNACRDKRLTHDLFDDIQIDVPATYNLDSIQFPCFAKPVSGSLSKNIRILNSQAELDSWTIDLEDMMFMEVISSDEFDEYTVDIYYSKCGTLKCVVPRQRIEVRGGEISKGKTQKSVVSLIEKSMMNVAGAFGCLTLQIFKSKTSDKIFGIEINPRFGGGFPLSNAAGAKYPEFLIREIFLNENIEYFRGWEDQLLMLRYDAEVFVHHA